MPRTLPILSDLLSHRYRVQLDGSEYVVRLTYRGRTASWYLDLFDADEQPIVYGRRLAVGWLPWLGHGTDRRPPGQLYVAPGPVLLYYAAAEISPTSTTSDLRAVIS